ncbi:ser-7 [Pristionchus pacificus]|uniref:Ser-7 n=1 Tax=Pristionchus pacificus TaxID=54126 RepID=A0A2A6D0K5_PRIPA|nr:ser-7 [Pristionchus pacificus]|eukprot:PDM84012.1 ser-7 [Pristionchus pacificus]
MLTPFTLVLDRSKRKRKKRKRREIESGTAFFILPVTRRQREKRRAMTADTEQKILIVIVVVIMIICTMAGNAMVCLAVLLVRTLKQPPNFLLVSLAVADFFVGCIVMPLGLTQLLTENNTWILPSFLCGVYTVLDLALCTASIVNLCMISVDRYLAISRPLRYSAQRTTKRILYYIAVVWIAAAIVSLSSITFLIMKEETVKTEETKETCDVPQDMYYQIGATIIAFYAPTIIMVIVYVKIWRAAKRLAMQDKILGVESYVNKAIPDRIPLPDKRVSSSSQTSEGERKLLHRPSFILHNLKFHHARNSTEHSQRSENKAQKTLGVMMGIYIVCWLPFFVRALYCALRGVHPDTKFDLVVLWLGYSNSMLNPMIYCKYNKEFRVPFREMLCCRFSTLQNVMRHEEFNNKFGDIKCPRRVESNGNGNGHGNGEVQMTM